jgi:hypothetical protein
MGAPNVPPADQDAAMRDFYKVLIDTRNLEINLFWQRSNYFLVLNTGIAFGFFNLKEPRYIWAMAVFGLMASILWVGVSLGGKYWHTRWEQRLHDFETKHFPDLMFFAAPRERADQDVSRGLHSFGSNWSKRLIYEMVPWKPSVSYSMILLALLFVCGWVVLIGMLIHSGTPAPSKACPACCCSIQ